MQRPGLLLIGIVQRRGRGDPGLLQDLLAGLGWGFVIGRDRLLYRRWRCWLRWFC